METNKEQLLRNSNIRPTSDVIEQALGDANGAYMKFLKEIDRHDIQLEWRYYNDGKAWLAKGLYQWTGVRGGQHETTVFWLSIWDGYFKVTIYVSQKARAEVFRLPMDDGVKRRVTNSTQMGKLHYFPLVFDLYSQEEFESIFSLIDFKKRIK